LRRALSLRNVSTEDGMCADIVVCGALANGRRLHHLVPAVFHGRFKNLPTGSEASFRQSHHSGRREAGRRRWLTGGVPV